MYEYLASKVEECCCDTFFLFSAICSPGAQSSCRCDDYCISQPQRGQWIQGKPGTPNLCLFYNFYFIWIIFATCIFYTEEQNQALETDSELWLSQNVYLQWRLLVPMVCTLQWSLHWGFTSVFLDFSILSQYIPSIIQKSSHVLYIKNMKNKWEESGK